MSNRGSSATSPCTAARQAWMSLTELSVVSYRLFILSLQATDNRQPTTRRSAVSEQHLHHEVALRRDRLRLQRLGVVMRDVKTSGRAARGGFQEEIDGVDLRSRDAGVVHHQKRR